MSSPRFTALIDYEDRYVQPLIVDALRSVLPEESFDLVTSSEQVTSKLPLLQIRAYESIDFEHADQGELSLFNAYVIRKALIRKHYLSNTIFSWVTKNPNSVLRNHFKPAEDFELDYAEFLDDALVEAFELRAAFARNEGKEANEREWWILKPGMSDRGQGIRLFSTEDELTEIFEEWEAQNPDSDEEDEENVGNDGADVDEKTEDGENQDGDYIMTSHLRHFIAQPYIHPPRLIPTAPYHNRKFHIRTYVVAAGALNVYVYSHMLALFASESYKPPWETQAEPESDNGPDNLLQRMRNIHLTNTCVQSSSRAASGGGNDTTPDENVFLLSSLPLSGDEHASLTEQIHSTTAELFRASLAHPTNFQPLPQAFEVFGFDFLVDENLTSWLLEVNAFPDFAQTGDELRDVVVKGLWEEIVGVVVQPHFAGMEAGNGTERLVKVLHSDMKRR